MSVLCNFTHRDLASLQLGELFKMVRVELPQGDILVTGMSFQEWDSDLAAAWLYETTDDE